MPSRVDLDFYPVVARRVGGTAARGLVRQATSRTYLYSQGTVPFGTGNLKAKGRYSYGRTASLTPKGTVMYTADYAAAVHEGARPHIIRPRRKKALSFTAGGRRVVTLKVSHPGNRSQPWLYNALRNVAGGLFGFRVGRR